MIQVVEALMEAEERRQEAHQTPGVCSGGINIPLLNSKTLGI
jgi:hypothetical protein